MNTIYLSKQGYDDLKSELQKLKSIDRPQIINQISEARDKGDLSENAEYDAAKEAQGLLEMKIVKLEEKIASARVVDTSKLATDKVLLYSTIRIKNLTSKMELNYTLVPESESNIVKKKISVSSPIGKGLLGKKIGEIAKIDVPSGTVDFKILSISRT